MSPILRIKASGLPQCGALALLTLTLAGCNRDDIKVQQVPREVDASIQSVDSLGAPTMMPAGPHAGMDMGMGNSAPAQVKWTLPAGWQEKPPSQMRVGSFNAQG